MTAGTYQRALTVREAGTLLWWYAAACLLRLTMRARAPRLLQSPGRLASFCLLVLGASALIFAMDTAGDGLTIALALLWLAAGVCGLVVAWGLPATPLRIWRLNPFPIGALLLTAMLMLPQTEMRHALVNTSIEYVIAPLLLLAVALRGVGAWMRAREKRTRQDARESSYDTNGRPGRRTIQARAATVLHLCSLLTLLIAATFLLAAIDDWQRILAVHKVPTSVQVLLMLALSGLAFAYVLVLGMVAGEPVSPAFAPLPTTDGEVASRRRGKYTDGHSQGDHRQGQAYEAIPMNQLNTFQ